MITTTNKIKNDYWNRKLDSKSFQISLPYNSKRISLKCNEKNTISFKLDVEICSSLKKISKNSDLGLYILILSGINIVLNKYCETYDITIGSTNRLDNANTKGFIYFRNIFTDDTTLKEIIENVRREVQESFSYGVSLEESIINADETTSGYTNIAFIYEKIQHSDISGIDYDLRIRMTENNDNLSLSFEYETCMFEKDIITGFFNNLEYFLSNLAENVNKKLVEINVVSESELKKLLSFNNTSRKYNEYKSVIELFEKQVEKTPKDIALEFESQSINYKELNSKANQLSYFIQSKGIGRNDVVAILYERSIDMIVNIIAVLKTGAAYLPIDPNFPKSRILTILDDSYARLILTKEINVHAIEYTKLLKLKPEKSDIIYTGIRPSVTELDSLPLPDRTLVDYSKFHKYIGNAPAKNTISLLSTRGCPFACNYCHRIWPSKQQFRTAENIFEEISLYYKAGVKRFVFLDDIFNLNIKNSTNLLTKIIEHKYQIQLFFPNGLRADILKEDYIDLLVEAGTINFSVALESVSERIQKLVGKNLKVDKFIHNIDYILKNHPQIILEMELMIGFPNETEEEALKTLDQLKKWEWVHFPNLNILKIYPNSDMSRMAIENGISEELIEQSANLAFHEIPETLPYPKRFVREYQSKYMTEYFLNKNRLKSVLHHQLKVLTEDELVKKYDSYLPISIKSFSDILKAAELSKEEFGNYTLLPEDTYEITDFTGKIVNYFPKRDKNNDAYKILFIDLSQQYSKDAEGQLYDVMEAPLGLLYLLTYLNKQFGTKVDGKIIKVRADFDSYEELKQIIDDYNPNLVGIRTLSFYKEFFHKTISKLKQSFPSLPLISGGPYISQDYQKALADKNLDLAVIGEGEITIVELLDKILKNNNKIPDKTALQAIKGLAFISDNANQNITREVVFTENIKLTDYPVHNPPQQNEYEDLAYVLYTSGSTGKPKGVAMRHRALTNLINWQIEQNEEGQSKNTLQFAPYIFDVSFQEIFSTLCEGGKLVLCSENSRIDTIELLRYMKLKNIERLFLPSVALQQLATIAEGMDNIHKGIKEIITAGDQLKITPAVLQFVKRMDKCSLYNHYGPTESHVVTSYSLNKEISQWEKIPPIGKPIANAKIYILNKALELVPVGVIGELYIGDYALAKGYLNNSTLTDERFIEIASIPERIYKTGDLARWLADGNIEFIGRTDHQVKIRGFRIELGEIESELLKNKDIEQAVLIAHENEKGAKLLVAYYKSAIELEVAELKRFLLKTLPDYMIPAYFVKIEKFKYTSSGKIDSKELPNPTKAVAENRHKIAPQNSYEDAIAAIWKEVLDLDDVSTDDNFYDLGGNSLNIVLVSKKINEKLSLEVSAVSLFNYPTIASIAEFISNQKKESVSEESDNKRKEVINSSKDLMKTMIMKKNTV